MVRVASGITENRGVNEIGKTKRPLRLLFVVEADPSVDFSGPAPRFSGMPSMYNLLLGCRDRGHEVHYIQVSDRFPHRRIHRHAGIILHDVPRSRTPRSLLLRKMGPWRFTRFLTVLGALLGISKRHPPDLIYSLKSWYVWEAFVVAKLRRVPLVNRAYGTFLYPVLFGRFRLVRYYRHLQEISYFLVPGSYVIMTNDGTLGNRVLEKLQVPRRRLRFWLNGVDQAILHGTADKRESRALLDIDGREFVIVCISRLVSWKRVDRIISAMPLILRHHPHCRLVIAGEGVLKEELISLCRRLGVANSVEFLGRVEHERIPMLLAASDLFVSLYDLSNVGNPLLEALAAGKCILTLDIGGTSDVITDGSNGRLIHFSDLPHLPEIVCELIENPELRRRLEHNAKRYAMEHLETWTTRIQKEVAFAESLCQSNEKRHSKIAKSSLGLLSGAWGKGRF